MEKLEKAYKTQIFSFPSIILDNMKKDSNWELVNVSTNAENNQDYEVRYMGKIVLRLRRLYGFGFGCQAYYPFLSISKINLLRTLIPNYINILDFNSSCDVRVGENEYTE